MYYANSQAWRWFYNGLGLFHEERGWKTGHTGSYNGSLLPRVDTGREPATISTAIRTWDELHIYA